MAAFTAEADHDHDHDQGPGIGYVELVQAVPVVRLNGDLDLLTQPQLTRMLHPVVSSALLTVVVDTSLVTFIDCAGLRPLLSATADLRRRGAQLLMLNPSAAVVRLCTLTGTGGLLDVAPERAPTAG